MQHSKDIVAWLLNGWVYSVQQRDDAGFGDYYEDQTPLSVEQLRMAYNRLSENFTNLQKSSALAYKSSEQETRDKLETAQALMSVARSCIYPPQTIREQECMHVLMGA